MANTDLRRLMQLKKSISHKITHPLAKYNKLDQLVCVICLKVVKDDAVWNAHLQSRKHKENVLLLKSKVSSKSSLSSSSSKSSSSSSSSFSAKFNQEVSVKKYSNDIPIKSAKAQLPDDFFDQKISTETSMKPVIVDGKTKSILKGSKAYEKQHDATPGKEVDESNISSTIPMEEETITNNKEETSLSSSHRKRKADSDLPVDFFDQPKKEIASTNETTTTDANKDTEVDSTSKLPQGFFDDPKKDAEARNVEYKDPKEKEWEMFQKMIQEETKVAETIQEEDDEESEMNKDLLELNKMKSCLSRVENLKKLISNDKQKKLELRKEKHVLGNDGASSSGDEDEDMNLIFDWRSKMA